MSAARAASMWLLAVTTTAGDAAQALRELHPYQLPQIVATPLEPVSDDYARWVCEQVPEA